MKEEPKSLNRRQFLRVAGAATAGFSLGTGSLAWSSAMTAVPRSRLDRLAKGANICRWFRGGRRTDQEELSNDITEAEAGLMKRMGLTHVRLCLQPRAVMDQSTGAIREETARFVDAAIERFHRAGLLVLLDLHNEDRPSELNR